MQRQAANLTQTALADQLGVTFQQVQKYEKGVNRMSAGRLTKIADVLGVTIGALLGRQPTPRDAEKVGTLPAPRTATQLANQSHVHLSVAHSTSHPLLKIRRQIFRNL